MDLVFDFHKRGFGMDSAPFLDIDQDLFTLTEPAVLLHVFFHLFSLVPNGSIVASFGFFAYPLCKKLGRTPITLLAA